MHDDNTLAAAPTAVRWETPKPRPPTSTDVARLAGVSRSTVSLVLNQVPDSRITEETRKRVLAAAEQLSYTPHAAASALRGGRNRLVLLPYFNRPYVYVLNVFYDHLAARLTELGYTVMFHKDRVARGPDLARRWASLRPVGVIAEAQRVDNQALALLKKVGTRVVLIGDLAPTNPQAAEGMGLAGICAARYLISAGHRWIGVVVPRRSDLQWVGLERLKGAERVANEHGVSIERIDLSLDGEEAARLALAWRSNPHPSGIFAYNDEHATVLMRALLDAGLTIPSDVAIMGCDNLWLCDFLRPRLTSIAMHPESWARATADRLHAMIADLPYQETNPDEPRVIVRESA